METIKKDVVMRLRRIQGQVRGLERMVSEGAPCQEILTQVAAVHAAMKKVGMVVVASYLEECLDEAQEAGPVRRREAMRDFRQAMARYMQWA
jgi:DNA-binding FrmR family transcriptional regulator